MTGSLALASEAAASTLVAADCAALAVFSADWAARSAVALPAALMLAAASAVARRASFVALCACDRALLTIASARPEHADQLEYLQTVVFPTLADEERFKARHYRRHIELFPEGQFVGLDGDRVVAATATIRLHFDFDHVNHTFGEIIQGAFSGAFSDPKPILQQYADAMNKERDRAIEVAKGKGVEVSVDDWKFDAWTPGEDSTSDKY